MSMSKSGVKFAVKTTAVTAGTLGLGVLVGSLGLGDLGAVLGFVIGSAGVLVGEAIGIPDDFDDMKYDLEDKKIQKQEDSEDNQKETLITNQIKKTKRNKFSHYEFIACAFRDISPILNEKGFITRVADGKILVAKCYLYGKEIYIGKTSQFYIALIEGHKESKLVKFQTQQEFIDIMQGVERKAYSNKRHER